MSSTHTEKALSHSSKEEAKITRSRTKTEKGQAYEKSRLTKQLKEKYKKITNHCKLVDDLLLSDDERKVRTEYSILNKLLAEAEELNNQFLSITEEQDQTEQINVHNEIVGCVLDIKKHASNWLKTHDGANKSDRSRSTKSDSLSEKSQSKSKQRALADQIRLTQLLKISYSKIKSQCDLFDDLLLLHDTEMIKREYKVLSQKETEAEDILNQLSLISSEGEREDQIKDHTAIINHLFEIKKRAISCLNSQGDQSKEKHSQKSLQLIEKNGLKNQLKDSYKRIKKQIEICTDLLSTNNVEMVQAECSNLDKRLAEAEEVHGQLLLIENEEEKAIQEKTHKKIDNQVFDIKKRICNWLKAQEDPTKSKIQTVNSSSKLENTGEHVPENSISNQNIVDMVNSLIDIQAAPNIDIDIFSGNPLDYRFFRITFKEVVEKKVKDPRGRLSRLLKFTSGDAKELIKHCIYETDDTCYSTAISLLDDEYGNPQTLINSYLNQLKQWPSIKLNDGKAYKKLHNFLRNGLTFQKEGKLKELDSESTMRKLILSKMDRSVQEKWLAYAVKQRTLHKKELMFSDIVQFLEHQTKLVTDPSFSQEAYKQDMSNSTYKTYAIKSLKCAVCSEDHDITNCKKITEMNTSQRWTVARRQKLCFRCLNRNHIMENCKSINADVCTNKSCKEHHKLLHTEIDNKVTGKSFSTYEEDDYDNPCSLRTLAVILHHNGKQIAANAILDDGSDHTFVNIGLANVLGVKGENERCVEVDVLNGLSTQIDSSDVSLGISSETHKDIIMINAQTTEKVVGDLDCIKWQREKKNYSHLKGIKFTKINKGGKIDILIGTDYPYFHRSLEERFGEIKDPVARRTPLGWTCIGKINPTPKVRVVSNHARRMTSFFVNQKELKDINETMKQFWSIEGLSPEKMFSPEDQALIDNAEKSMTKSNDGIRYKIEIPWNENKDMLTNNYSQAIKRLENTEKQLSKREDVKIFYQETINSHIENGYIKKNDKKKNTDSKWYLPHFPVVKWERETTKIRIVFDGATSYKGIALNDAIHQGPNLQQDLLSILFRFRKNKVALVCDIAQMYHQVELHNKDKPYVRFLWRDMKTTKEPSIYEFQTLLFGLNAAPFLAQYVSQTNAKKNQELLPRASETVLKSTYMDDCLDSVESIGEAHTLYQELTQLWEKAGMKPRKWLSNEKEVLKKIPTEHRAKQIDLGHILPYTKTLGVIWNAELDEFSFKISYEKKEKYTKRSFLKLMASVFDPFGILAPFVMKAKLIMQSMWLKQIDWDETLSTHEEKTIEAWIRDLDDIHEICIPRCISQSHLVEAQIHVFVDASEDATASVAYYRTSSSDRNIQSRFLCAKTRIAPIETLSVPRLELMAAEIGSELGKKARLALQIQKENVFYWSDSNDVLGWIKNRSKLFQPFVAHRVSHIQQNCEGSKWLKISSKENPADIASRGSSIADLKENQHWLKGPTFLEETTDHWPKQQEIQEKHLKEKRKNACKYSFSSTQKEGSTDISNNFHTKLMNLLKKSQGLNSSLDPKKFSSWKRLCRITAWILRFIINCRKPDKKWKSTIQPEEFEVAEKLWIKNSQRDSFVVQNESVSTNNQLSSLCPKLDSSGIIRANTRIINAEYLNYNTKYPMILPRGHRITELIVKYVHENGKHERGTNGTLADISSKYWLIAAREEIRSWERKCNECKKRKAKVATQIMAPLPYARVDNTMRAFNKCGLDFAGPFETKQGRGKTKHKRYLCLFTCLATRGVHLEMAYSLDTSSFLNAFWRFTHRRGVPKEITSDNGKNFVAGKKELQLCTFELEEDEIINKTAHTGLKWIFNPPLAPHHGGVFESMIKAAKKSMGINFNNADITDEELNTLITGAECMINSRPITYQTANPVDSAPLTPNHFLHGQVGGKFAPTNTVYELSHKQRWRRIQEILNHFWKRWLTEWIPSIGKRNKWTKKSKNCKVGDIVLVLWPDLPRSQWPLGKIIEAIDNNDGNVRRVKVLVKGKEYERGLNTIYPLNLNEL